MGNKTDSISLEKNHALTTTVSTFKKPDPDFFFHNSGPFNWYQKNYKSGSGRVGTGIFGS